MSVVVEFPKASRVPNETLQKALQVFRQAYYEDELKLEIALQRVLDVVLAPTGGK